jgi:serine/threonine protein phosphatase 1
LHSWQSRRSIIEWLDESKDNLLWYKHGGEATVLASESVSVETKQNILNFEILENYHLDEQRRLYVHAGFTNVNGVNYEYFPGLFYWDRTLWETALALDKTMATDNIFSTKRFLYEIYITLERH